MITHATPAEACTGSALGLLFRQARDAMWARMERELAALQTQVKSVEETYGIDNLHLTVARGYVAKLLANNRVVRWLATHQQDYLSEFQKIAEIDTLGPIAETPGA